MPTVSPVRLLAALVAVAATTVVPAHAQPGDAAPAAVIVRLHEDAPADTVLADLDVPAAALSATYRHATTGFAAELPPATVERLRAHPHVAAVEPDVQVRLFQVPTGVRRIGAHEYGPADIDGDGSRVDVDVAILDTGVDAAHPDLVVAGGVDCRTGSCTTVATPTDLNGHGTHVAGTAAARDDGVGVVGVAPGARVHAVQVLEADGTGPMSALLAGLDWVRANADRIDVANLSLGCECKSTTLDDVVRSVTTAGVTLVVAAGNAGTDAGTFAPANHPDVVAVAAMSDHDGAPGRRSSPTCVPDADDSFASYSNYGAVVDLVAPGSCITSTLPGARYGRSTGTSMAAPHVAGAAALLVATEGIPPSTTRAATVRQALLDRFSVPSSDDCGYTDSVSIAPMLHLTCVGFVTNAHPTLDVTSPSDGLTVVSGQTIALRAAARDAEDGDLSGRIVWTSSQAGRLGTGGSLDVALTELGDHTVVASVTDSSGANVRTSRLVRVTTASGSTGDGASAPEEDPHIPQEPEPSAPSSTDNRPVLTIIAPVPDAQVVTDRQVQLVSRAVDVEDGDIRSWVRWRSDRDGDLGAGGTVGVELSAGAHRITATVTDAAGNTVERTTGFTVAAPEELGSRGIRDACPPEDVPDSGFGDVGDGNPHGDAIDCVAWWGITRGAGDGTYAPSAIVSRAQMATFLAEVIRRSGGSLPASTRDHFDDDDGNPHEDNINGLAELGIVRGLDGGRYGPSVRVTRDQMATFLVRAYEQRAALPLPGIQRRFDDVGPVHGPNVDAAAVAGIAAGVTPDRFDPSSGVRRDQMASFIARTLDLLVDLNLSAPPSGDGS